MSAAGVDHRLLLYEDPAAFVGEATAFLREGLRAGDRILAAATTEKHGWLRDELGGDAGAIDFMDADALYARHGPMFRDLMEYIRRHGTRGHGRVRIIAEQSLARRSPADRQAYLRYEAAANAAYRAYDVAVLCPYDGARLPDDVLEDALRTHPEVVVDGRVTPNERFEDPRTFVRTSAPGRAPERASPAYVLDGPESLVGARTLVRAQVAAAGFVGRAADDLVLAVTEIATNALVHGDAPRQLWSYLDDGRLVFQVRDAGAALPDPLTGYLPPDPDRLDGRGLWLAHQLCDIVEVGGDATRTDVLLHVRLPVAV